MKVFIRSTWFVGAILLLILGCQHKNRLEKVVDRELAKEVRNDSLFLGLHFGITLQEFYDRCWELNRQGIAREGSGNMSVEYLFKDSLDQPIAFNFYAEKNGEGPIHQYNATFNYYAWVLNRHLYSDRLMEMMHSILMEWYGGNEPFTIIKEGKEYLYKVDGNRMIELHTHNEGIIKATFYDLTHQENLELIK